MPLKPKFNGSILKFRQFQQLLDLLSEEMSLQPEYENLVLSVIYHSGKMKEELKITLAQCLSQLGCPKKVPQTGQLEQ